EDSVTEERLEVHAELRPRHAPRDGGPRLGVEIERGEHLERNVWNRPRRGVRRGRAVRDDAAVLLERLEVLHDPRKLVMRDVLSNEVAVEGLTDGIGFPRRELRRRTYHLDDVLHGRSRTEGLAKDLLRRAVREPRPSETLGRRAEG